jgi:hypothetical protein
MPLPHTDWGAGLELHNYRCLVNYQAIAGQSSSSLRRKLPVWLVFEETMIVVASISSTLAPFIFIQRPLS